MPPTIQVVAFSNGGSCSRGSLNDVVHFHPVTSCPFGGVKGRVGARNEFLGIISRTVSGDSETACKVADYWNFSALDRQSQVFRKLQGLPAGSRPPSLNSAG